MIELLKFLLDTPLNFVGFMILSIFFGFFITSLVTAIMDKLGNVIAYIIVVAKTDPKSGEKAKEIL